MEQIAAGQPPSAWIDAPWVGMVHTCLPSQIRHLAVAARWTMPARCESPIGRIPTARRMPGRWCGPGCRTTRIPRSARTDRWCW